MSLDDQIIQIEAELASRGLLERVYRRDGSKPDRPLLLDADGMPQAGWRTKQIYPAVAGLLEEPDVQAIAATPEHRRWAAIKERLGGHGIARLHSRLFLGPPPVPDIKIIPWCERFGIDPRKI